MTARAANPVDGCPCFVIVNSGLHLIGYDPMTARTLLACFLTAVLPSACVQTTYKPFDAAPAVAVEAPKVLWEKTVIGRANAIAVLPDGDLAVVGITKKGVGRGRWDGWVRRFDDGGRLLWDKTFGGEGDDEAYAIAALPDGGLAVAGTTDPKGAGEVNAWVLRLDDGGRLLWEKTFVGKARAIAVLPDGGLAVAGHPKFKSEGRWMWDAWVARLDGDGQLLWEKTFIGGAHAIAVLPDGGLAVAGMTKFKSAGRWDAWMLRLDGSGRFIWDRTFGGRYSDSAKAIAVLPDGGLVVAGSYTKSKGAVNMDAWVLRLDDGGRRLWERTAGGSHDDEASAIAVLPDGDLAVVGWTKSKSGLEIYTWVRHLDDGGRILWEKTFGGGKRPRAIAVLPDGGLVVAGWTRSKGAGFGDAWVLLLESEAAVAARGGSKSP